MGVKSQIGAYLNKSVLFQAINFRRKIERKHKRNEKRNITDKKKPIYYIISFDDPQSSGWTVWERVALFASLYAEDHGMIPVMDMKNHRSIYQNANDFGKVNVWDKYYLQPGKISLETALESNNYVLADTSVEWFQYLRMRRPKKYTADFLREKYSRYIKLQQTVIEQCESAFHTVIPNHCHHPRLFGIKLRGTDYIQYHHSRQPDVNKLVEIAKEKFEQYHCDYYFISTEDAEIYKSFQKQLPPDKIIGFNSGNISNVKGFVGAYISKTMGEDKAALDYIITLYLLDKCCCLLGGVCGATIVAQYRKNPPYEYVHIIDYNEHY